MDRTEIENKFRTIRAWRRGDEQAPHKPLLLLYALGRLARGGERLIPFREVDEQLAPLLKVFLPAAQAKHTEYPFWRLQNDGIWEVEGAGTMQIGDRRRDPSKDELLECHARAGFTLEIARSLRADPTLTRALAFILLNRHFPEILHDNLLRATGLLAVLEAPPDPGESG